MIAVRAAEARVPVTSITVQIAPATGVTVPQHASAMLVDVVYTRTVTLQDPATGAMSQSTIQETARGALDGATLHGAVVLADMAPSTALTVNVLGGSGTTKLQKSATPDSANATVVNVALTQAEVDTITTSDPLPAPQIDRQAFFVPVGDTRVPFDASNVQVAPVTLGSAGWRSLGLDQLFHADQPINTSIAWNGGLPSGVAALAWAPYRLAADGRFAFSVPQGAGDAWLWWLSGPLSAFGIVLDDLVVVKVVRIGIALPPFAALPSGDPTRVPTDVTEAEVATNPQIYTEDPGEFCRPFKNPERVLGERSFFTIMRVEQPVVSAQASVKTGPLPIMTFQPASAVAANVGFSTAARTVPVNTLDTRAGAVLATEADSQFLQHAMPSAYLDFIRTFDRGRLQMDADHPVQWEGDSSRYQATTVARGHILEYRMRWRSNGYSLGTVAKTLTLAPRQTKRIQKIDWNRSEFSKRTEDTQQRDSVSDSVSRDRDYQDSVEANLSEWARGESESSAKAGAAGAGFAMAGFVIGGGGTASSAESSSSQEGGRRTSASEEQRLRDSIRRYGDALRKLDSVVVNEVTQEESVTGTTEVVRNSNYGHALTVIYYQILRHLKIETGIASVHECLFVPFAITPFTVARAYRWREFIRRGLRDQQYAGAITYLKDVLTNFAHSDVPPGRRSDQPVRYIYGSFYVQLAVDRPKDKDDGSFDPVTWVVIRPFLGVPALNIFTQLKALEESVRDTVFQRDQAPVIAASWVDTLQLTDKNGTLLPADFTLATRYQFNGVVRVDFTVAAPTNVTRETLSTLRVTATRGLPPGSVANMQSLSFTYETDQFQRSVTAAQGAGDLVVVETGIVDAAGATIGTIPDVWERRDIRGDMISAVQELVEHLNEHVEYYSNFVWWNMDRNRLFMLIDGFYVPGTNGVSIASVVERDPIAIIGNSIVFRVSAGSFLGLGNIKTPDDLYNYYVNHQVPTEPMLVSLPTDGLYAQTVMDECVGLEEHFGNTDWVLNDPDPELGEIAPELLASRRADPVSTQPAQMPQTLINLQNAPDAPAPSGLAAAFQAVTTPNAFRDMAGLAGTQANAQAAMQAAAALATNFGNQAAALKMAQLAKDAHATQTADQKLATVQRAVDKNLLSPADAQAQASKILDSLHGATASPPHQDPIMQRAVFAASGQPGSTIEATTADGMVRAVLMDQSGTAGGGSTSGSANQNQSTLTLPGWSLRQDGIDVYTGNNLPSYANLSANSIRFVVHKSSEQTKGGGLITDGSFPQRWTDTGANGILRGAYHFYRHKNGVSGADQADTQIGQVKRLVPGDFAPALDFENDAVSTGSTDPNAADWRDELESYLDRLEIRLGRIPMIYTSTSAWGSHVSGKADYNASDYAHFADYPLWVKAYMAARYVDGVDLDDGAQNAAYWAAARKRANGLYKQRGTLQPPLPATWKDWQLFQYSPHTPGVLNGVGFDNATDFDVSRGGIYSLRGLADLGRPAPHQVGNLSSIAYTEADGRIYVLEELNDAWRRIDVMSAVQGAPLAAGDPAAGAVGNEQIIVYRGRDGGLHALRRTTSGAATWAHDPVAPGALDDAAVLVDGATAHVVFRGGADRPMHATYTGGQWRVDNVMPASAAPNASGAFGLYTFGGAAHAVSRAGDDGHLVDLFPQAAGVSVVDVTAGAHDDHGDVPPPATYRPAIYVPNGQAPRIAFRALRGAIWIIERDTLNARNLAAIAVKADDPNAGTPGAPMAAGSPTAIGGDVSRVFYRSVDGLIIEIFNDGGTVKWREIWANAAADPVASIDQQGPLVTFRSEDGTITVLHLINNAWMSDTATDPSVPGSLFGDSDIPLIPA
jgi:GH25 family lysozyme M1 (1,4-beta-N-acetylmuramidase)